MQSVVKKKKTHSLQEPLDQIVHRSGLVFFKATGTRRCVLFCSDMSEQLNSAAQSLGIMYIKGIYNSAPNTYTPKRSPPKLQGDQMKSVKNAKNANLLNNKMAERAYFCLVTLFNFRIVRMQFIPPAVSSYQLMFPHSTARADVTVPADAAASIAAAACS